MDPHQIPVMENQGVMRSIEEVKEVIKQSGLKLTEWEVEEVITQVTMNRNLWFGGPIKQDDFDKIIKLLKEPTVDEQLGKIYEILDRKEKITLYGESGVGKTWIAKKIADRAVRQRKFDVALWVCPDRFPDRLGILESVVRQLKPGSSAPKEPKAAETDGREMKDDVDNKEAAVRQELKEMKVLFIIVHEGSGIIDTEDSTVLRLAHETKIVKIVRITRTELDEKDSNGVRVMPLSRNEAKTLLERKMESSNDEINPIAASFVAKSRHLPSEVIAIAKTTSFLGRTEAGLQKLRDLNGQALADSQCPNTRRITSGYEFVPKSVLVDCYSSETDDKHFLHQRGMVHHNELISYWILEGHLGHFTRIEDAYDAGHRVLMDLLDCGLLKKTYGGYVSLNRAKRTILDADSNALDYQEFFKNVRLGLATTFDNKLGANIEVAEGAMKIVDRSKKDPGKTRVATNTVNQKKKVAGKMTVLLLDGNRRTRDDVYDGLSNSREEIEVLAIFNPRKDRPFLLELFSEDKFCKLRLLVIRGCQLLEDISDILCPNFSCPKPDDPSKSVDPTKPDNPRTLLSAVKLRPNLTVFELSGPSSLNNMPNNFFHNTPNLKSLNLSFLDIEVLPDSFYEMQNVEVLILRGCSKLKEVKSLRNLGELQVLDLSGATSLERFHDRSLWKNKKLQILDLSKSRITRLPVVSSLTCIKSLTLNDCKELPRICRIGKLRDLQILDISGAEKVKELMDASLGKRGSLKVLDVSRTLIQELPGIVGRPRFLYLRGCLVIKELNPIENLDQVEVLDLSGSCNLENISPEFFKSMKSLRELNLSNTGIRKLENLSSLEKLEVLDVSGCRNLIELDENSFEKIGSTLRSLNVSKSRLNLVRPRFLYLRGCLMIKELNPIENLDQVEVLDLSGSCNLENISPEFFKSMKSLRELNLSNTGIRKLENLSSLEKLEVLDASGCRNLIELDENSFEKIGSTLRSLNVSKSRLNLVNLRKLCIRCCPNLTDVPGLENIHAKHDPDEAGTVLTKDRDDFDPTLLLNSPRADVPDFSNSNPLKNVETGENERKWSISNWKSGTLGVSADGVNFIQLLITSSTLLSNYFGNKFHFLIYPSGFEKELQNESFENEFSLRKVLYLDQVSLQDKCLEIRGFSNVPSSLQPLIKQAELVCFVDNLCLKPLNDVGLDGFEDTKACWIERCNEMELVAVSGDGDHPTGRVIKNLQFLRVFDAMKLKRICNGITFEGLKFLYLHYCPNLSVICSNSSQLQNLELLEIRYCQALESLFEDGSSAKLENLKKLTLWGLPKLKKIDCCLPNLQVLRAGECPSLEEIQVEGDGRLQALEIKFCDSFRCLSTKNDAQHEGWEAVITLMELTKIELCGLPSMARIGLVTPKLETMKVAECDKLKNVVDSENSRLEKLKILEVKDCEGLKTVFEGDGFVFGAIEKVELLCLPQLTSIGAELEHLREEKMVVWGCPKFKFAGKQPR